MTKIQLLAAVKLACRITSDAFDSEFLELIDAAYYDLEISGVADTTGTPYDVDNSDQLVITAVKTYVKINFGDLVTDVNMLAKLKASYDEQKAQLKMRNWSDSSYESEDEDTVSTYRILENGEYLILDDEEEDS